MYLIALAELARAPFTLVDEINQVSSCRTLTSALVLTLLVPRVWILRQRDEFTTLSSRRLAPTKSDSRSISALCTTRPDGAVLQILPHHPEAPAQPHVSQAYEGPDHQQRSSLSSLPLTATDQVCTHRETGYPPN